MATQYELSHTGAQVDAILTDAAADHAKLGAASGIATLGADGKVPAAQMPQDVYAVQGYDSDMDAAGVTVSDSEITANYRVVWLVNADGTGRFAAEAVPSAVGQPLHARWPGSERMCGANGASPTWR